jgi:SAM-dependent methyltransferase
MNNDAQLYSSHDHEQKVDVNYFLSTYWNLLKWKNNENVLDVGAATGDVTTEILLPRLPTDLKKIVGVDIEEDLVSFAKRKFKHVSKADFVVLDIASSTVPEQFYEHFGHIFSFNCLNWVPKERHEQAMRNIYDMLQPSGQLFAAIVSNIAIYDIYENMARENKWQRFFTTVEDYVSIYHHSADPARKLVDFLKKVGFVIDACKIEDRTRTFPTLLYYKSEKKKSLLIQLTQRLSDWAKSVNPFVKYLPEDQVYDYIEDFCKESRKHEIYTIEDDGKESIRLNYQILVACASKPENIS